MVLLSYDELRNSDNPLAPIAQTFVGAACGVRRVAPYLFTGIPGASLFPSAQSATDRFWERICDPRPEESQPRRPLGGNCDGVPYDGQLYDQNGSPTTWTTSSGGGPIPGPIEVASFQLRDPNPNGNGLYRTIAFGFTNFSGATRGRVKQDPAGAYLYDERWSAQLFRTDGLPDSCDEPPPPPPPVDPPDTTINIPVTVNNIRNNYDVELPDLVVNNWPDFEFSPVFKIGDITAEFTLGGINFPDFNFPDWPEIPPIEVNLTPTLNAIADLDVVLQAGIGNINIQIEGIRGPGGVDLTELEELIRCCACEEGVTYEPSTVEIDTGGGAFLLPPNSVAVLVIAAMPFTASTPTIARSGTEDDVFLWGTFAIAYADGTAGVVQRLSYQSQSAPVFENGFNITVTPHYENRCSIIAITKMRNC